MKLQRIFGFIWLVAIVGEFVETRDLFKFERPYKYYRPRFRDHRQTSAALRRPSVHGHPKRTLFKSPHYYRRQPPSSTWNDEQRYLNPPAEKDPYTIEIEFPKRYKSGQRIKEHRNRNYRLRPEPDYHSEEEDYLEDFEDEAMHLVRMGLRIKAIKGTNPNLRIKVSRDDRIENDVKPVKFVAAVPHLQYNDPPGFFHNFNRENSHNRMPVYFVTEFPEYFPGA
ncbi:uncharacterized protein [Venturia canescens]|uniref:uncharacterized protein isoform X1 n=1 Tax=Venturia canescens TaxID=32260 RepID=UPI001C9C6EAD|nr:uncharacterized protein LOC122410871 isoform X1 [Venturia canescens]